MKNRSVDDRNSNGQKRNNIIHTTNYITSHIKNKRVVQNNINIKHNKLNYNSTDNNKIILTIPFRNDITKTP